MTTPASTVAEALAAAGRAGVDRLDARLLLSRALDRPRTWLFAHADARLADDRATAFASDCSRLAAGEPLAYILGTTEFYGLSLTVDPRVLVPRPDTELLVDWAIERIAATGPGPATGRIGHAVGEDAAAPTARPVRVLDLGTGSGAVALAIRHACPAVHVLATDTSPAALEVATGNAARLGLSVDFVTGSWWRAVAADARFDLVVSNPPYIAAADDHLAALRHEPLQALTSGTDGLASLREIVAGAALHLQPSAWLLLEHGHDQGTAVRALLEEAGFAAVQTRLDLAGRPRCSGGRAGD